MPSFLRLAGNCVLLKPLTRPFGRATLLGMPSGSRMSRRVFDVLYIDHPQVAKIIGDDRLTTSALQDR